MSFSWRITVIECKFWGFYAKFLEFDVSNAITRRKLAFWGSPTNKMSYCEVIKSKTYPNISRNLFNNWYKSFPHRRIGLRDVISPINGHFFGPSGANHLRSTPTGQTAASIASVPSISADPNDAKSMSDDMAASGEGQRHASEMDGTTSAVSAAPVSSATNHRSTNSSTDQFDPLSFSVLNHPGSNDKYTNLLNSIVLSRRDELNSILVMGGGGGFDERCDEKISASGCGHPLYEHNVCKWPGCELMLGDLATFIK